MEFGEPHLINFGTQRSQVQILSHRLSKTTDIESAIIKSRTLNSQEGTRIGAASINNERQFSLQRQEMDIMKKKAVFFAILSEVRYNENTITL